MKTRKLCWLTTALLIGAGLFLFSQSLPSGKETKKPSAGNNKKSKQTPGMGTLPPLDDAPRESRKFGEKTPPGHDDQIVALQKKLATRDMEVAILESRLAGQKSAFSKPGKEASETITPRSKKLIPVPKIDDPPLKIAPVYFKKGWVVNDQEQDRVLEDVTELLKEEPGARISLVGHADDSIYDQTNQVISLNRARFIAAYLVAGGVPKDRLNFEGIGNSQKPKIGPNRRVDIYLK